MINLLVNIITDMYLDSLFLVLTFIIVIVIILITDNLATAVTIISLIASFFVIYTLSHKAAKNYLEIRNSNDQSNQVINESADDNVNDSLTMNDPTSDPANEHMQITQNTNLYGAEYEKYHSYVNSYDVCAEKPQPVHVFPSDRDISIDTRVALNAQRRARDKKTLEGAVVKDANFYKYHFADELETEENKPWWSRGEY